MSFTGKRTVTFDLTSGQLYALLNAIAQLDCEWEQNGNSYGNEATKERQVLDRARLALLHGWDRGIKR